MSISNYCAIGVLFFAGKSAKKRGERKAKSDGEKKKEGKKVVSEINGGRFPGREERRLRRAAKAGGAHPGRTSEPEQTTAKRHHISI